MMECIAVSVLPHKRCQHATTGEITRRLSARPATPSPTPKWPSGPKTRPGRQAPPHPPRGQASSRVCQSRRTSRQSKLLGSSHQHHAIMSSCLAGPQFAAYPALWAWFQITLPLPTGAENEEKKKRCERAECLRDVYVRLPGAFLGFHVYRQMGRFIFNNSREKARIVGRAAVMGS